MSVQHLAQEKSKSEQIQETQLTESMSKQKAPGFADPLQTAEKETANRTGVLAGKQFDLTALEKTAEAEIDKEWAARYVTEDSVYQPMRYVEGSKVIEEKVPENTLRDIVGKAAIMSILSAGKNQVTMANYQIKKSGGDELVITDLNPVLSVPDYKTPAEWVDNEVNKDSDCIQVSRTTREKRFEKIRRDMEHRRVSQ